MALLTALNRVAALYRHGRYPVAAVCQEPISPISRGHSSLFPGRPSTSPERPSGSATRENCRKYRSSNRPCGERAPINSREVTAVYPSEVGRRPSRSGTANGRDTAHQGPPPPPGQPIITGSAGTRGRREPAGPASRGNRRYRRQGRIRAYRGGGTVRL